MTKRAKDVDTYDFGWFTADVTYSPTTRDPEGCDGLYIKSIRIKWFGYFYFPFLILWGSFSDLFDKMTRK